MLGVINMENKFNASFLAQQRENTMNGNFPFNRSVEALFESCLLDYRISNLKEKIDAALDQHESTLFQALSKELASLEATELTIS